MTLPLQGIRILDLSRLLPGPFCTLYLAQLGAEVIKVEESDGGDYCRALSPELFALVNRGKQSVTLDLRRADEVERFHALADTADAVLESFRPGVMARLGCGYAVLAARNPKLVFASLTGYGQTGPWRDRAGHDMNYRGYAGELHQNGASPDAAPVTGNFQMADLAGGALTCALGIVAALLGARATGKGCHVDAAMLDGTLALQVAALASLRTTGSTPPRGGDVLSGGVPNYALYSTKCGGHLALGALEPKFFAAFCRRAERLDLLKLPIAMGERGEALRTALRELVLSRSRDEWEALLAGEDSCASAVLSLEEALKSEQVQARGLMEQVGGKPAFGLPLRFVSADAAAGAPFVPAPPLPDAPRLGADDAAFFPERSLR